MWFLAGFRARMSAGQERGRGCLGGAAGCGLRCCESCGRWEANGCSWRTVTGSLDEGSARSRGAFRRRVMLARWVSCPPARAVPIMSGCGAGSSVERLPTLCATEPVKRTDRRAGPRSERGGGNGLNLATMLISLPTLTATNARGNGYTRDGGVRGKERLSLTGLMRLPTLTKSDGVSGPGRAVSAEGGANLRSVMLPTLTASMVTAADMEQAGFHSGARPRYRSGGGQLSPMWCEWYMGFPLGWTELRPLEMRRCREWRRRHSLCWRENWDGKEGSNGGH